MKFRCIVLDSPARQNGGERKDPPMTFLTLAAVVAVVAGTVHTAHLVATDGLTRIPTRRA